MRLSLTDRYCNGAKAGSESFDEKCLGLSLRVSKNGHRAWCYHYTLDAKRARLTLASFPSTSLATARRMALEARGHVEAGMDPRRVYAAHDASAMTVADLVASYVEKHVRVSLRASSARNMEWRLAKNVTPVIGSIKLADLHRRDVNRVLDAIMARGSPHSAGLVYADLRGMLRWGVARGDLDRNPIEGSTKPSACPPRDRVLSDAEIHTVWNRIDEIMPGSSYVPPIINLALTTGQRIGEICGMSRDELDLPAKLWRLPASRTKNGHAHSVPLSDLAVELIEKALAASDGPRLFPVTSGSVTHAISQAQPKFGLPRWVPHDCRRSVVTGMARLGISPIVLGHCVNHRGTTKAGVTLGVYNLYGYEKEKREAMDLWGDRLRAIVAGKAVATVTPLRRA